MLAALVKRSDNSPSSRMTVRPRMSVPTASPNSPSSSSARCVSRPLCQPVRAVGRVAGQGGQPHHLVHDQLADEQGCHRQQGANQAQAQQADRQAGAGAARPLRRKGGRVRSAPMRSRSEGGAGASAGASAHAVAVRGAPSGHCVPMRDIATPAGKPGRSKSIRRHASASPVPVQAKPRKSMDATPAIGSLVQQRCECLPAAGRLVAGMNPGIR